MNNPGYAANIYFAVYNHWEHPIEHLWTLAVEEQFYLLWPFLVLFLPRRFLFEGMVTVILSALIFRIFAYGMGLNEHMIRHQLISCCDALAAGGVLAYILRNNKQHDRVKAIMPWLLVIGMALMLPWQWLRWKGGDLSLYYAIEDIPIILISASVIYGSVCGREGIMSRILQATWLVGLGKISYGVYLYHNFVPSLFSRQPFADVLNLLPGAYSQFLLFSVISIAIAIISWFMVEKPINQLKQYVAY